VPYVFDTSALIDAWVNRYPPDAFERFWEAMEALGQAGSLLIPAEVYEECGGKDDGLHDWVKARAGTIVVPTTRAVMIGARAVLEDHPALTKPGKGRGKADPFVIALAAELDCPLVTQEQGGTAEKPRIPFVCRERGVDVLSLLDVIRAEGWRF
jgi:hypothetical protein